MPWGLRKPSAVVPALLLICLPSGLEAQGVWDVVLTIQPFPSPYYSDWQANPNIGSLTVMNNTGAAATVQVYFTITDQMNRVVVSGTGDPQTIEAGAIKVYDSPYQVSGSATHDARIERIASRTGRLPEGNYTACAAVADASGFVLGQSCADFTIAYPDPPELLGPDDGADITSTSPLFQWTPVQVPADYQLTYDLRIVEVMPGQLPSEALRSNIPVYEDLDAMGTVLRYPIDALPLDPGKTYAWSVQALDQNGYPASANQGRSEIRTFKVSEPASTTPAEGATMLTLESTSGADSSLTVGDEVKGLHDICALPDSALPAITLPVNLPGVFGGQGNGVIYQDTVTLYRDPATSAWAIVTRKARLSYLLYGQCGTGAGALGGLQWIAVRRTGRLGDLMDGVPITPSPASQLALRFGVAIFSFTSTTTTLPQSFARARDFLDYHQIDLKPGVNVFGVVDLKEHRLWPLFQALGYTDKYVELQGFLGLAGSWSIGGRIAHTPDDEIAGEVSVQRTLLWLRAALPEKQPLVFRNLFATSQVGLEFTVQDSTAFGVSNEGPETRAAVDLILSANLTLTTPSGVQWHGSIGVDATQEHRALAAYAADKATASDSTDKEPLAEPCWKEKVGGCFKYVLKLGVDQWQPLTRLPAHLSDVELEADINDGFLKMLATRDPGSVDWDVIGSAGFGLGQQADLGKLIVGFGRSADSVEVVEPGTGSDSVARRPARKRMNAVNLERPQNKSATASETNSNQTLAPPQSSPQQGKASMPPTQPGAEPQAPAPQGPAPQPESSPIHSGKLRWGVRITLGNMSLQDLIKLIARSHP